ncbi:ParB/RepB/Spo0J family partition protein [Desulfoplanes formicivorans]|uniref:Chromosome partitioning protein ParB n=1 Tax=Desulfoplanes formicivorans TaxID=1592317 RepID=A0A194AGK5_9BACT|nr:ParB/RepB/Spo0J family partition protein [Desulfoplanes formicivorans]GAU08458.1 chromosome partitioning protein ParB [Desulfoplanes formicivorans]
MSVKTRGLGKGLDLLLKGSTPDTTDERLEIREIPLTDIFPNPSQPRQEFVEESLDELARSIRSQGVLQPILVRPRSGARHGYEIVAGERRWRASQRTDLKTIPALVRDIDDKETLAIALIENLQREDLNPIEEAMALERIKQELELSQEELARQVGRSRSAIANSMRLLNLPPSIQKDLAAHVITPGHARAYLALNDPDSQKTAHDKVVKNHLNVRQTEALVRQMNAAPAKDSPADDLKDKAANKRFCQECKTTIEKVLGKRKGLSLRVSGGPAKGSITLSYANARERERVLRIMEQGAGHVDNQE